MIFDDLIIVSDTHVAEIWEKADKIIPKELNFLNSNTFLKKVVADIEPHQKLILNGDLTDYNYFEKEHENNNLNLLLNILSKCRGKYYCNIGNHDYRRLPYSWKFYGIKQNNASREINRKYLNDLATNYYNIFRDLRAYQVNIKKHDPNKDYPFDIDYHKTLNHSELIFLNTGFDYIGKILNFFTRKSIALFLNYRTLFFDPPVSVGLNNQQIEFLKERLDASPKNEVIIFLHHPPFFGFHNLPETNINQSNYLKVRRENRLETGIFLQNNLEFIEAILKSRKSVIVISSHVHTAKQYLWNKKKGALKSASMEEINQERHNSKYVKFLTTLPLGAIGTPFGLYKNPDQKVGLLRINEKIEYEIIRDFEDDYNK